MKRPTLSQTIAILLFFCGAATAGATTRTVTNLDDSGVGTLRAALTLADDGDVIDFAVTGKIQLTSGTLTIAKNVTINGPGASSLNVDGGAGAFRIFTIAKGFSGGVTATISGLLISNGHSVDDHSFLGGYGGGINTYDSSLTVRNCILSTNHADYLGGGIYAYGGDLTVINCLLEYNGTNKTDPTSSILVGSPKHGGGGAIYKVDTRTTVTGCTFSHNGTQSTIAGSNGGGAIFNDSGSIRITNSTFYANAATAGLGGSGGAIYNTTTFGGRADAIIQHCTLSENAAPSGGGIANQGANGGNAFVALDNTILFSSSNTPGANLYNTGDGTAITSNGFNLSSDDGGGFLTKTGDQKNTDPKLGPLQDNGGPTQTMALLSGSPAQDKGSAFPTTTDQRGLPRPMDLAAIPNAPQGDGSDIGAVEMDGPQSGPTFNVTTTDDHDDGTCSYVDCTLREAVKTANAAAGVNEISFNDNVQGLITLKAALGTLIVTDSVTIVGPGARVLAVNGNQGLRVFSFTAGNSGIVRLTIRGGAVVAPAGSGGGGIFNASGSSLVVAECNLFGNSVQAADATTANTTGGSGNGGAIANAGSLTVAYSTFNSNSALGGRGSNATGNVGNIDGGPGGPAQGGALFNDNGGILTIYNCTFGGNSATGGAGGTGRFGGNGGLAAGGGLYNLGSMVVTALTVSKNTGTGGAGGKGNNIFNNGASGVSIGGVAERSGGDIVRDTIIAGNVGRDADGIFTSQGYNLIGIGDFSTGFTGPGDKVGTTANPIDPKLGPLQNNQGETDTFALTVGSPAIDAGQSTFGPFSLASEQRGGARIVDDPQVANGSGDASDIGAYEAGAIPPVPPTVTTSAATNVTTTSATLNVTINPHGYSTTFSFTSDFAVFPSQQAGNGVVDVPFSVNVFGLTPNTTYHFNASATNVAGWGMGAEQTFTTAPQPGPTATPTPTPTSTPTATPTATSNPPTTLANVSTRLPVQTGDNALFAGFIITGTQDKKVAIVGVGPSLSQYFSNPLVDPVLELYSGNTLLESNDNWVDSPNKQAIIDAGLTPSDNHESVIIRTLPANGTGYSAILRGVNNGTGIGVVEAFDLDRSVDSKLANISTRGLVQTGDNLLIAGTIIVGQASQRVLICALGPSLGLQGSLADPILELHDGNGVTLETNDNWVDSPNKQAIMDSGAPPPNDKESAIIRTLPANGAQYTAIVRGVNNTTGVAVVEVFALN